MRILVVDDDAALLRAMRRGLEAEGFAVDTAGDGTEGEWLARENPYDVVVLDVMLPGRDGYDVCARLRDAGVDAPVLMLTAKNAVSD